MTTLTGFSARSPAPLREIRMRWESVIRLPGPAALVTALLLWRLLTHGLSWSGVAALLVALLWFALTLIDWLVNLRRRRRESREALERALEEAQTPSSLVMLLDGPRAATAESVARCVREALGGEWDDAGGLVEADREEGEAKGVRRFLVSLSHGVFAILLSDQPYVSDPGTFAQGKIRDKRLRTAVERHLAWFSVDLVSAPSEETEGRVRGYDTIGKLVAAMAGPDCLALYAPELRRCNEFDFGLIERLQSGSPLAIFREPTFEPVVEIEEDHPRMAAAVEEARRRWPEFALAFERREIRVDDRFIIKAEFVEGRRSEFMWVAVTAVEEDRVFGLLLNDPHQLETVHRGKEVSIDLSRLNDWIYPDENGEMAGGFTLRVLSEEEEERRRRRGEDGEDRP